MLGRTSCSPEGAGVTTLWQKGEHLWAEMRGELKSVLEVADEAFSVDNDGAGRGISSLPNIGGAWEVA